jgi:hypothetical protein
VAEHAAARFVEHEVAQGLVFGDEARCSHSVLPGGGATPPTMTSPTSPSAWQETMWITLLVRILRLLANVLYPAPITTLRKVISRSCIAALLRPATQAWHP